MSVTLLRSLVKQLKLMKHRNKFGWPEQNKPIMNITNYTLSIKPTSSKVVPGSENIYEYKVLQLGEYTPLNVDQEWNTFQGLINQ